MERGKLSLPSSIKLSSGNASFNRKLSNTLNYQTEQQKEKQKWEGTKEKRGYGDGGKHIYSITNAQICNIPIYGILGIFRKDK